MTDAVVPTNSLEQWRPDFGPLPTGWVLMRCDIDFDIYAGPSAAVEFGQGRRDRPHMIRVRANPTTPDIREWLFPLMERVATYRYETFVDIDAREPIYGAWSSY